MLSYRLFLRTYQDVYLIPFENLLLRHSCAKRVLEVGTSSGYSGLFLADAMRTNGGLITCEMSDFKIALAKESFER